MLSAPPASTQGPGKQKEGSGNCEEWELLTEVRRMLDERRKVGGGLVMRLHGSRCDGRAWPPILGLGIAVLELSEGMGGDSRLS